jgi:hypothetical protein
MLMANRNVGYLLLGFVGMFLASICSAQSVISDKTVRAQVVIVKSSPSDIERAASAEDLFNMLRGKDLTHVSSQTIQMISGLVSRNHDGVTIWIAAALGEFGHRASFTAPRLIEVLKEVECRRVDASSAFTIRTALKKMGKDVSGSECLE